MKEGAASTSVKWLAGSISTWLITGIIAVLFVGHAVLDVKTSLVMAICTMSIVLLAFGISFWKRTHDFLDVGLLSTMMFALYLVLPTVGLIRYPDLMKIPLDTHWLASGMWICSLGATSFLTACYLSCRGVHRLEQVIDEDSEASYRPRLLATVCFLLLSLAVRSYLLKAGLFGYSDSAQAGQLLSTGASGQLLSILSDLGTVALVVASLEAFRRSSLVGPSRKWRLVFCVSFSIEMVFGIVSGMKGAVIVPVEVVALAMIARHRRFPRMLVVGALVLLAILVPVNSAYREMVSQGQVSAGLAGRVGAVTSAAASLLAQGNGLQPVWNEFARWFTLRNSLVFQVSVIAEARSYSAPLLPASSYFILPAYIFIPRVIWPDKPILNVGNWFAIQLLGAPSGSRQSEAVSIIGDTFWTFGLAGALICMSMLGLVFGRVYSWERRSGSTAAVFVYIFLLLVPMLWFEGSFAEVVVLFVRRAIEGSVLTLIVYPRKSTGEKRLRR